MKKVESSPVEAPYVVLEKETVVEYVNTVNEEFRELKQTVEEERILNEAERRRNQEERKRNHAFIVIADYFSRLHTNYWSEVNPGSRVELLYKRLNDEFGIALETGVDIIILNKIV